jgi:hypothetical protein
MYDPLVGQFTQPDALVPDPFNPIAFNRYAYAYNSPLVYTDPTGHIPFALIAGCAFVGALIGGASYIAEHPNEYAADYVAAPEFWIRTALGFTIGGLIPAVGVPLWTSLSGAQQAMIIRSVASTYGGELFTRAMKGEDYTTIGFWLPDLKKYPGAIVAGLVAPELSFVSPYWRGFWTSFAQGTVTAFIEQDMTLERMGEVYLDAAVAGLFKGLVLSHAFPTPGGLRFYPGGKKPAWTPRDVRSWTAYFLFNNTFYKPLRRIHPFPWQRAVNP